MKKFTILVCLYKKDITDAPTIQSLLKNEFIKNEFQIYIWDNSPTELPLTSISLLKSTFPDLIYRHCPSNMALSKLYNIVINEVSTNEGYLLLCDDDTQLPAAYFEKVITATALHPNIKLFLPKIISGNKMISPAKNYVFFSRFFDNLMPGQIKSRHLTAINSGMVISNDVFKNGFRYDERLNFYCTDNYFMIQFAVQYERAFVLDVSILHDISFNSSPDIDNKIKIFKELKRANKIIYKNKIKKNVFRLNNFIVSLKLCIRYKTLQFLYD